MLARNNLGVLVPPGEETEVCRWVADGYRQLLGFVGTAPYTAEFRLYVGDDPDPWYTGITSPFNYTTMVVDRGTTLDAGTVVSLRVYHEAPEARIFKGTILGG